MTPVIRPAGAADHPALRDLRAMAAAAAADHRGGRRLVAQCPSDHATVTLVATLDDSPVGYLEFDVADIDVADIDEGAAGGRLATVRGVFVRPEARELGCGDELLAAAVDAARRRGCTVLDAIALPGDRHTKNLYERAGIVARAIVVSTNL